MTTRFINHLLTGNHASRPAANAVPEGALYSCTTHNIVYQSDGVSTWSNWADVTGGSPSGNAGGDLTGTYPDPRVVSLNTIPILGSPLTNQFLMFTGSAWRPATLGGLPPAGLAGGDLTGTYPDPRVVGLNSIPIIGTPTNNQVLLFTGSAWRPSTFVGGGGGGAPTDAEYVTTAANGSLSAELVISGLAGNADRNGAGGAGTSREFESGDALPTWTASDPATQNIDSTIPGHLYILQTDNVAERLGLYAWAPAGDFDARIKMSVGSNQQTTAVASGLIITDSGNSNRILIPFSLDITNKRWTVESYSYASSTYTQRGSTWGYSSNEVYLRITRVSGTVSWYFSHDGILWQFIASLSFSITVANIGIRNAVGGAVQLEAAIDWLRTDV